MEKTLFIALAMASVVGLAGCPDKEKNASIDSMNKGSIAIEQENYATAIKHFSESTKHWPGNHRAWNGLGHAYYKSKELEQSVEAFENAVKNLPSNATYRMWYGLVLYESGRVEEAKNELEKAAELNSDLYRVYWFLGRAYRDLDEPSKAAQAWTRACTLNPLDGRSFAALGHLYLTADHVDQAIQVLEEGAKHAVDNEDLTNIYHYLGLSYDAKNEWDKAIDAYTEAISYKAENTDAKFQRGLSYAKAGKKNEARKDLEEYLKSSGDNSFNKSEANKALLTVLN